MPFRLQQATIEQRGILENLLQLYLHEMSRYSEASIGEDGRFNYPFLDLYWEEAGRYPYLLYVRGGLAGFVLVRQLAHRREQACHEIAEFFILETHRELGLGEEAARMVFDSFPGVWHVGALRHNKAGIQFWKKVIFRYGLKEVTEATSHCGTRIFFEFETSHNSLAGQA
ncbi:MAG: hypothetical protein MUC92_03250 [Fimbriimonadaceae bacterium]|jgi:predicted acetyltransferase|nr:hypothetical protein [Fimbriimonadaceae bacterium]